MSGLSGRAFQVTHRSKDSEVGGDVKAIQGTAEFVKKRESG